MPLPAYLEEIRAKVSNWGRWGDDDERGCANLLTPESLRRGLEAVVDGRNLSLAVPLDQDGPQVGQPARRLNAMLTLTSLNERDRFAPGIWAGTDDMVTMSTAAGTHIDALSHITYDGLMYNGFPADSITASAGATRCGIEKLPPIVTRGVLLDIARLKGVERLDQVDPGYAITAQDLDAAADAAGVMVQPGDALLVRTGQMRHFHGGDRRAYAVGDQARLPGLSVHTIAWLHAHDVAAAFTDTYAYEAFPPPSPDWSDCLAVHMLHIRDMGLVQGQNWDLEALADDCAADGRATFLLTAHAEPITGASSAPVRPVATK